MVSEVFLNRVKQILLESGFDTDGFAASACRDGGNNLVYEVHLKNKKVLAKQYYRSSSDQRDRLEAEWAFIEYARKVAPRNVPATVAIDRNAGIGIFEFVEGQKVPVGGLTDQHVDAAAQFFNALNGKKNLAFADSLPSASEACFSIAEHIEMVDSRIDRLGAIEALDDLSEDCIRLVSDTKSVWQDVRGKVQKAASALSVGMSVALPLAQRCISPSDFGFHNALVKTDGEICFIDFEYAGWDDPAKMVTDFFCQPQVPVPDTSFEKFLGLVMSSFEVAEELEARARLLWPAQRVKWICIMLNIFLSDAAKRRLFADPEAISGARKKMQLDKARLALQTLEF